MKQICEIMSGMSIIETRRWGGWTEHDVVLVKLSCLFSMVGHLLGLLENKNNKKNRTIFVCGTSKTSEIYLRSF